jgi:hypothetical protein
VAGGVVVGNRDGAVSAVLPFGDGGGA